MGSNISCYSNNSRVVAPENQFFNLFFNHVTSANHVLLIRTSLNKMIKLGKSGGLCCISWC